MGGPPPPGAEDGGFAGAGCIILIPCVHDLCAPEHEALVAHHAHERLKYPYADST